MASDVHEFATERKAMWTPGLRSTVLAHRKFLMFFCSVDMRITDTWGYAINGSWTGLTGYLQREEADIGTTGMFVLKQRLSVVNYIAATTPTRFTILIFMYGCFAHESHC
jgi:hypothetical protein